DNFLNFTLPGRNFRLFPVRPIQESYGMTAMLRSMSAALVLALAVPALGHAQAATIDQAPETTFELSVANIMRGPEHVGSPPAAVGWTDDGRGTYFLGKPGGLPRHEEEALYRVAARGGERVRLSDAAADAVAPILASGDLSADKRSKVVAHDGDLYLID